MMIEYYISNKETLNMQERRQIIGTIVSSEAINEESLQIALNETKSGFFYCTQNMNKKKLYFLFEKLIQFANTLLKNRNLAVLVFLFHNINSIEIFKRF